MRRLSTLIVAVLCLLITACLGNPGASASDNKPTPNPQPINTGFTSIPVNNSIDVALTPQFELYFSEPMDLKTVTINTVYFYIFSLNSNNTTRLPLDLIQVSNDQRHFIFKPQLDLAPNRSYQIELTSAVKTISGKPVTGKINFISSGYSGTHVTMLNPLPDGINVSRFPYIYLQFSQSVTNVNSDSITLHRGSLTGEQVAIRIETLSPSSYLIYPINELRDRTTYYLRVNPRVTTLDYKIVQSANFKFTTSEFSTPDVALISPEDLNKSPLNYQLYLKFNQQVKNVNINSVKLYRENQNLPIQIDQYGNESSTLYKITLLTQQPLLANSNYSLVLNNQILSLSNKNLPTRQIKFSTLKMEWNQILATNLINGHSPQIAISPNQAAFIAYRSSLNQATVKMFTGTSWVTIGEENFSPSSGSLALAINPQTNQPAIATLNQDSIKVWEYTGFNWQNLDSSSIYNSATASMPNITFDHNGNLWLAFYNTQSPHTSSIYQYSANSWINRGMPLTNFNPHLAYDPQTNRPYLAVCENCNLSGSGKIRVYKLVNENWSNVALNELPVATDLDYDLKIAADGTPYIAFINNDGSYKVSVMRLNNGNWESVGNSKFAPGGSALSNLVRLAIDRDGNPYVVYQQVTSLSDSIATLTMMRFINGNWQKLGPNLVTNQLVSYYNFVLDGLDIPYIIYSNQAGEMTVLRLD